MEDWKAFQRTKETQCSLDCPQAVCAFYGLSVHDHALLMSSDVEWEIHDLAMSDQTKSSIEQSVSFVRKVCVSCVKLINYSFISSCFGKIYISYYPCVCITHVLPSPPLLQLM
jgi:hypothetical protein